MSSICEWFTIVRLRTCQMSQLVWYIVESKSAKRHTPSLQHLQNIVAPDVFNLQVVYDSCTLAYLARLAGFSPLLILINLGFNTQVPQDSREPNPIWPDQWRAHP
ncbi:hypothetical protein BYT27DRAFT_7252549 [Phlegmacium glaucopus]|nr:hypothetical protein BYT27DRAFT_7252549 [Phlegmacium glaucopus]